MVDAAPPAFAVRQMTDPRFTIVTPVYNTKEKDLEECISSVLAQTFTDWELCLVDDKSPNRRVERVLDRAAAIDSRVRVSYRAENGGIVAASNDGLEMARGEFVALLDHDDVLEPDALELVEAELRRDPDIDYVYTDETLMTEEGKVVERFHKPSWSPERFRHQMYLCHLSVIRRSLMESVGGFRPGFDGSQDYDLMFRVTENARKVGHVGKLLYHWRMAKESVANNASAKPYAYLAGQRAIESHLERVGIDATVEGLNNFPGNYRIRRFAKPAPRIEVLVPDTGSTSTVWGLERIHADETARSLENSADLPVNVRRVLVAEWSRAKALNEAVRESGAEIVVLTSEGLETREDQWVSELVSYLADETVAMVSGTTYTANSLLEHAGFFLHGSFLDRSHYRVTSTNRGQRAVLETVREFSAVDAQCLAIKRDLFLELGGLDESVGDPWDVVDLCLRAREKGLRILVTPRAEFWEFMNGNDDFARYRTRAPKAFRARWASIFAHDPYRPTPPLRQSAEAERPFWKAQRLRDFAQ
jgi:glycosyltransferase involved in cell wall biosynthesis